MYDHMRKELYWPHLSYDDHCTVHDCSFCAQNHMLGKPKRQFKLSFYESSLNCRRLYVQEPLPKTRHGKEIVFLMMDG